MAKIWVKNPKKKAGIGNINPKIPEFHRNWLLDTVKCVLDNLQMYA